MKPIINHTPKNLNINIIKVTIVFLLFATILPIQKAISEENSALMNVLMSNNEFSVNKFLKTKKVSKKQLNNALKKSIFLALSPKIIKVLISAGADPHIKDEQENSLLMVILTPKTIKGLDLSSSMLAPLRSRRFTLLKMLLEFGVDPNISNKTKDTPLILATKRGEIEAVKALLDKKASPNTADRKKRTPLFYSAINDYPEIAKTLLKYGANPNLTDNNKQTALMLAAAKGSLRTLRVLAKSGADLNKKDKKKRTAISIAKDNQQGEAASLLRQFGAKTKKGKRYHVVSKSSHLNNPFTAVSSNNPKAIEQMAKRGIELNTKNTSGNTPLLEATKLDYLLVSRALIRNGANVNATNSRGWTPLMYAASKGNHALVKTLLKAGAKKNKRSLKGRTAMEIAKRHGYADVAAFIKRH